MGMGKRPSFQFYPSDWRSDPAVQSTSLAAQGLWANLLCVMFECDPKGYLTLKGRSMTLGQLSRLIHRTPEEIEPLLVELEEADVFSRTPEGVIYCRRMVRDERKRALCSEAGKLGGSPLLTLKGGAEGGEPLRVPLKATLGNVGKRNPTPSSSSSSPSSGGMNSPVPPSCLEPAAPDSRAEALLTFPVVGNGPKEWHLLQPHVDEWRRAFPDLDVLSECRQALAWVNANGGRRKTARGMSRFLVAWLGREQNRGAGRRAERNGATGGTKAADLFDEELRKRGIET